jgi:hypothetical protein
MNNLAGIGERARWLSINLLAMTLGIGAGLLAGTPAVA